MRLITNIKKHIIDLGPAEFQILCDAYLARVGYPNLVNFGTMAGSAKTTKGTPDTYSCDENGQYIFAEYTTQTSNVVKKIQDDLKKCLDSDYTGIPLDLLTEIVYCHTSSNISPEDDMKLKRMCEERDVKLTLIGIDKLADELFLKYRSLVKEHLGISIDTEQIQTYEDFVKNYDENTISSPIQTDFMYREKELDDIDNAFESHNIVVLTGPAGVGKTRLALHYAKSRTDKTKEKLYCVHSRALSLYDDLQLYFEKPDNYFVFIDDANQLSEINYILEYVNKAPAGYNVKIIISVRDYALSKISDIISEVSNYVKITVNCFSDDQIKNIIKHHYGIVNSKFLERIARIAEGNSRIAMLAGKTSIETDDINSIKDSTELYSRYYGKILKDAGLDSNTDLLVTTGIIAFLNSFHIKDINPVLKCFSIDEDEFIENISTLNDAEIINLYDSQAVVFADQCLANYMLKYVFYEKKLISLSSMIGICFFKYKDRTINAIDTLINVFQSEDLISFVKSEIKVLWNTLKDTTDDNYFFEFVKAFYPLNPTETLLLLSDKIKVTEQVEITPDKIDRSSGKNYQNIKDDIITILGGFADDIENLDSALDLFFMYYSIRPDLYMEFYHSIVMNYSVTVDSFDCRFYTQNTLLQKFIEHSDNWSNKYVCLLFLDVAKELSKLKFSPAESSRKGKSITIFQIPIKLCPGVCEYRKIMWENLEQLAAYPEYIFDVIELLSKYGNDMDDCSMSVAEDDSKYIYTIMQNHCSPDNLYSCLTAIHLTKVFTKAGVKNNSLVTFTNNEKVKLYYLLHGPEWDFDNISYSEWEQIKKTKINEYVQKSGNPVDSFLQLYNLYQEGLITPNSEEYNIQCGINMAFESLPNNIETLIIASKTVLQSVINGNILIIHLVTQRLFTVMAPDEVYSLLLSAPVSTSNTWLFSYFSELPEKYVNNEQLNKLYAFLKDDSDKSLSIVGNRGVAFLVKFLAIDENVIIKSSKIILDKQSYSIYMVSAYFDLLFNPYKHKPTDVIDLFSKDIKLLEKIYLLLRNNLNHFDYHGEYLYAIFHEDKDFLIEYAHTLAGSKTGNISYDIDSRYLVFYQNDDYIDIIDTIVDVLYADKCYVPDILKSFLVFREDKPILREKCDNWITHYIKNYNGNVNRMIDLFVTLSEKNMEYHISYLTLFLKHNNDFEVFKHLPLTPGFYSWENSAVPLYSSWINHLEKLFPLFHGIDFIQHKNRVEKQIDSLRENIKAEKIRNVLEG